MHNVSPSDIGAKLTPSAGKPPPIAPVEAKPKLFWSVLYTKRSKKKQKSWLDGYIIVTNDRLVQLVNEDGNKVSSERYITALGGLKPGNTLEVSSWELEVQNEVSEDDYVTGRLFAPPPPVKTALRRPKQKQFKPLRPHASSALQVQQHQNAGKPPLPMYDPLAEGAVILLPSRPSNTTETFVPIVLDPFLAKRMRPHQLDGIKFLFECTAGRSLKGVDTWEGAILADEMGLGKSLQAIALIWTLIKQGESGKPLAKKAIIVCPASLVRNWVNEVRKWLGDERLKPVALESGVSNYESKEALAAFIGGTIRRLLIISYEMFRSNASQLYESNCGLIICDEGHRLKSSGGNKTIDALRKLPCRRRVILTGTPVQNDLEEFFAVCDFVNPNCLNSLNSFRSVFANPIIASRESNAPLEIKNIGEARAKQLFHTTSKFVLRRTSNILEKYLPPKNETAIFCRLKPKQMQDYEEEARRRYVDMMGTQGMSDALRAINYLRKICSHPFLIAASNKDNNVNGKECDNENGEFSGSEADDLNDRLPKLTEFNVKDSAKMQVTASICEASLLRKDRIIIVSNFTKTLDLMERMLQQLNVSFCRLDGSTPVQHRGDIVRRFNEGSLGDVFLLSAKAGGVGLNLIGANRLILFDPDWNPATDLQAMARVWRDGQKKHVYVYRLLCTGTIEEKIFQRQLFKGELQEAVDGDNDVKGGSVGTFEKDGNFKADELRDVFKYKRDVKYCETLDVLERSKEDKEKAGLLQKFAAYRNLAETENVESAVWCEDDEVLDHALNANIDTHGVVSYLYTKQVGTTRNERKQGNSEKRKLSQYLSDDSEGGGGEKDDDDGEVSDSESVEGIGERILKYRKSANESTSESSRKRAGKVEVRDGGVKAEKVIDLTWDDAIDGLLDE